MKRSLLGPSSALLDLPYLRSSLPQERRERSTLDNPSLNEGQILLLHRPTPELVRKPRGGFGGACKYDDARDRTIEAVYQPDEDVPGFVEFSAYEALCLGEQIEITRSILLNRLTCRFVHHQQMIVQIKNLHANTGSCNLPHCFPRCAGEIRSATPKYTLIPGCAPIRLPSLGDTAQSPDRGGSRPAIPVIHYGRWRTGMIIRVSSVSRGRESRPRHRIIRLCLSRRPSKIAVMK